MASMRIPEFTILPDCRSARRVGEEGEADYFDLDTRLGPMLDVLRHKETELPISMAVYGGVGSGKTSALEWLIAQIEQWNAMSEAERSGHPLVIPVSFSVQKCHAPAMVSKMILSDILLKCLVAMDEGTAQQRVLRIKQLAESCVSELGWDFLQGLEYVARHWGARETLRASAVERQSDARDTSVFLDGCHKVLNEWMTDASLPSSRIVVFLDDLDDAPPEILMAVFETVSLRLKSPHIGFVSALDPKVAQTLIKKHFACHEYGDVQCRHYLGRIFQVECSIEPTYKQIRRYYAAQYRLLDHKSGSRLSNYISPEYKNHIDAALIHLSSDNPRKIKVLLNSAMMKGYAGIRASERAGESNGGASLVFVQSVQVFLLQYWLSYFSVGESAINREDVMDWFEFLSGAAQESDRGYRWVEDRHDGHEDLENIPKGLGLHMIHEWVWDLLKIPFSKIVASQCSSEEPLPLQPVREVVEERTPELSKEAIRSLSPGFRDCLAAALEKSVAELSDGDTHRVVDLDLSGHQFTEQDEAYLARLGNLRRLDLHNSSIGNLESLHALGQLKNLNLTCTPIESIASLASLTGLETLDLSFCNIQDLSPLKSCAELKGLLLFGSPVSDLESLRGLPKLMRLNLSRTGVTDEQMEVLESLPSLNTLFLRETEVTPSRVSLLKKSFGFNLKIEQ